MYRIWNIIKSEFQLIGLNFYVPIVIGVFYILLLSNSTISLMILQLIIMPMSGWWIVWVLEHNLKTEEFKLLKTISTNIKSFFIAKFLFILFSYSTLIFFGVIYIYKKQEWLTILTLLLPQAYFFAALAYLLVIVTREASVSISLIYLYVISEVFPTINIPYWPNVLSLSNEVGEISEIISKSIITLLYGSWFLYIGNAFLNTKFLSWIHKYKGTKKLV